jgi:hypothetical protein
MCPCYRCEATISLKLSFKTFEKSCPIFSFASVTQNFLYQIFRRLQCSVYWQMAQGQKQSHLTVRQLAEYVVLSTHKPPVQSSSVFFPTTDKIKFPGSHAVKLCIVLDCASFVYKIPPLVHVFYKYYAPNCIPCITELSSSTLF